MRSDDSFRLISEEAAGAIVGGVVAALFVWDVIQRVKEMLVG